jgi:hypothetical protein
MSRALAIIAFSVFVSLTSGAAAESNEPDWNPREAREAVRQGEPLVVHVTVALCSNDQIDCGSKLAGKAGDLRHNIYWGAIFGARRFLERKGSEYERIALGAVDDVVLERAVYRRRVPGKRWGLSSPKTIEQIVVLDAVHGDKIDRAVTGFWQTATTGTRLTIDDGDRKRTVTVSVAGYVGHNRLMDGLKLDRADHKSKSALPSFVLACYSEQYFGEKLRDAGAEPLVMTRQLMAPEGYVLEAVLSAVGDGVPKKEIRRRAVAAYAKWSKLSDGAAGWIFSSK